MAHDPYALSDEDRLPWLEPVEEVEEPTVSGGGGGGRWLAPALALLALAALAIGGVWWWQSRAVTPTGSGELIAAPEGPYKVRPADEGGMKIEGQGEMAFATSEGAQVEGAIDLAAVPEAPVARAPSPTPSPTAAVIETKDGDLSARPVAAEPAGAPGATIQLGAFPSEAVARTTWQQLSQRFAYLGERKPVFARAQVNGRSYVRLRVGTAAAAEARDICARLRVAGENCLVVGE